MMVLAKDPRCPVPFGAENEGTRGDTLCRDHRQSNGENNGKRRSSRLHCWQENQYGRKRHIIVDMLGLIMALVIHAADIQDQNGAKFVIQAWQCMEYRHLLTAWLITVQCL